MISVPEYACHPSCETCNGPKEGKNNQKKIF